jgi:hypothetical protein
MPLYIFMSSSYPRVKAFTSDKTGASLPDDYSPWYPAGGDFDPVGKAVQRDGLFPDKLQRSTFALDSF